MLNVFSSIFNKLYYKKLANKNHYTPKLPRPKVYASQWTPERSEQPFWGHGASRWMVHFHCGLKIPWESHERNNPLLSSFRTQVCRLHSVLPRALAFSLSCFLFYISYVSIWTFVYIHTHILLTRFRVWGRKCFYFWDYVTSLNILINIYSKFIHFFWKTFYLIFRAE